MAASVTPLLPSKQQPLKSLNRSPKFLRNGYNMKGNAAKRKSAVELLQESKAYYVKSEQVRDGKQELKHTEHLQVTSNPSYDTLLRHPQHRTLNAPDVVPVTATTTPVASVTTTAVAAASSLPASKRRLDSMPPSMLVASSTSIEPRLLTVTLLAPTPRLQVQRVTASGSTPPGISSSPPSNGTGSPGHGSPTSRPPAEVTPQSQPATAVNSVTPSSVTRLHPRGSAAQALGVFHHSGGGGGTYASQQQQQQSSQKQHPTPQTQQVSVTSSTVVKCPPPPVAARQHRPPHLRSKTQPESGATPPALPVRSHHPEYRRSHSERDNNTDDIQMKLRRLLNYTDSKENLSNAGSSGNGLNGSGKGSPSRNGHRNEDAAGNSSSTGGDHESATAQLLRKLHNDNMYNQELSLLRLLRRDSPTGRGNDDDNFCDNDGNTAGHEDHDRHGPVIRPRHQQDGNYCIHKSMPDLSPFQLGGAARRRHQPSANDDDEDDDSDSDDSLLLQRLRAPKSVDAKLVTLTPASALVVGNVAASTSRSTSDYVSRSPSFRREEQLQRPDVVATDLTDAIGGGQVDEDGDSIMPMKVTGADGHFSVADAVGLFGGGMRRTRPILRSKSDISHRYSKSGTDLTTTGSPRRHSQSGAELERFFDTMGLDSTVLYALNTPPSDCSSAVFFHSVSTSSSSCCQPSCDTSSNHHHSHHHHHHHHHHHQHSQAATLSAADDEGGATSVAATGGATTSAASASVAKDGIRNTDLLQHGPVETSIVERNARVIKWLFNCRKVQSCDGRDNANVASRKSES